MLYHYSQISSLLSIMGTENPSQDVCPNFWARDIRFYTDQDELKVNFSFLQPIMSKIEEENNIPYPNRLSRIVIHSQITGNSIKEAIDFEQSNYYTPYIVCFSLSPNNSYLWNRYDEETICIHVDESFINNKRDDAICMGAPVMYGSDRERIEKILLEWYNIYQSYFDQSLFLEDINNNERKLMFALKYEIYPFIKPPKEKYIKEQEYRVSCIIPNKNLIKYDGKGKAFFEFKLPKSSIKRIDFTRDIPQDRINNIERKISSCGYITRIDDKSILIG